MSPPRHFLDLSVFLEVTEGGGFFCPGVKPQDGLVEARHGFQQGLVQRHVDGVIAGAGIEQGKGVWMAT